jgi:GNAT superfamily N-acetyltransferase
VESVLDVADVGGRFVLTERRIPHPFVKDYDAIPGNGPCTWPARFSIDGWGLFSARLNEQWVGAAAIAADPALVSDGPPNAAVLWDLRVSPDHRHAGIGRRLFATAEQWARDRSCNVLLLETQNINVAACRFYERQGCVLDRVGRTAYPTLADEIQLLWRKALK